VSKNAVETVLSNAADATDALLADAGPETQQDDGRETDGIAYVARNGKQGRGRSPLQMAELLQNGQAPYVERLSNAMEGVMILIRFSGK
jgi:hypothetical protein